MIIIIITVTRLFSPFSHSRGIQNGTTVSNAQWNTYVPQVTKVNILGIQTSIVFTMAIKNCFTSLQNTQSNTIIEYSVKAAYSLILVG